MRTDEALLKHGVARLHLHDNNKSTFQVVKLLDFVDLAEKHDNLENENNILNAQIDDLKIQLRDSHRK